MADAAAATDCNLIGELAACLPVRRLATRKPATKAQRQHRQDDGLQPGAFARLLALISGDGFRFGAQHLPRRRWRALIVCVVVVRLKFSSKRNSGWLSRVRCDCSLTTNNLPLASGRPLTGRTGARVAFAAKRTRQRVCVARTELSRVCLCADLARQRRRHERRRQRSRPTIAACVMRDARLELELRFKFGSA